MVDNNETVAGIVSKVRSGDYGCAKCGDLCDCPNADKIIASIADRIEEAHQREVEKLTAIINTECRKCSECAKFGKDCTAADIDGAEDNRACEKFVSREVAELRECLGSMQTWFRLYFHCDNNQIHPNRSKCTTCRLKRCPCHRWRKALEGANHESKTDS